MCKWGTHKTIHVIRRNHPDIEDGWHEMKADACIADYVQAMNDKGIITINCCCGHGEYRANVLVARESVPLMLRNGYECTGYNYSDEHLTHFIKLAQH